MIDLMNKNGLDLTQSGKNVVNTLYNNLYSLIVQLAEQRDYEAIYWVKETMRRLPWCKEKLRCYWLLHSIETWWGQMTRYSASCYCPRDSFLRHIPQLNNLFSDNKEILSFVQEMLQDLTDKEQTILSTKEETMKIITHRKVGSDACQIEIYSANGTYFNSVDMQELYEEENLYKTKTIGDIRITSYGAKSLLIQCNGVTILYTNDITYNFALRNSRMETYPQDLPRHYDIDILITDGVRMSYKNVKEALLEKDLRKKIKTIMNQYKYGVVLLEKTDFHRLEVFLSVMKYQDEKKRKVLVNDYIWNHCEMCSDTEGLVRYPRESSKYWGVDKKEFDDEVLPELKTNGFAIVGQEDDYHLKLGVSELDMSQTVLIYLKCDYLINKGAKGFSKSLYNFIHAHNWAIEYLPVETEWETLKKLCRNMELRFVILPNITESDVQLEDIRWCYDGYKKPEVITQSQKITKRVGNHDVVIDIEIKN